MLMHASRKPDGPLLYPVTRVCGPVVHGDKRGRLLGFPTANVGLDASVDVPSDGVYAGRAFCTTKVGARDELLGASAISIGTNPTFAGTTRRVEVFILDFSGNLYDQVIDVDILERIRGQIVFASVDGLVTQMERDIDRVRAQVRRYLLCA